MASTESLLQQIEFLNARIEALLNENNGMKKLLKDIHDDIINNIEVINPIVENFKDFAG